MERIVLQLHYAIEDTPTGYRCQSLEAEGLGPTVASAVANAALTLIEQLEAVK